MLHAACCLLLLLLLASAMLRPPPHAMVIATVMSMVAFNIRKLLHGDTDPVSSIGDTDDDHAVGRRGCAAAW